MRKKIAFLSFLSFALVFSGCKPSGKTSAKQTAPPSIATIGGKPVLTSEFSYVYKKNNASSSDAYTSQSINEYLKLYTNFKLKVREAEALGLDTSKSFIKELEGYKKQLAQPYLTEKGLTEQLVKEAYERLKEEVNASHILFTLSPDAEPKDTLEAYNKILEIRQKALSGVSFEKLAREHSQDPSAKTNGGNLGYFTGLQMVYPFEDAAYKTPVGQISMPVRTRFGYHIINVHDKRKSQGQVKVAHIMVRATSGMPEKDSLAAKEKADEIYSRLTKGEDWNNLASQFSDDANSKGKGGELPWFSTGKMIPTFEEASFKLKAAGEFCAPVLTPYGWHIIKLLEKKELESFEQLEPLLRTKVTKDSRSELNKTRLLQRLKKENNFVENSRAVESAVQLADSSLLSGAWTFIPDPKNNTAIFSINKEVYTINDFLKHVKEKQKPRKGVSPSQAMRIMYKEYSEEKIIAYEEAHLEEKYEDYKMLVKEYRDGILLFQLMDERVWSKAIEDTSGLKEFFGKNREKYKWGHRAEAAIYNTAGKEVLEKLKTEIVKGRYTVKNPASESVFFQSGKTELPASASRQLDMAAQQLLRDKNLILEIEAGADAREDAAISLLRAGEVLNYLKAKGIDPSRVLMRDLGKAPSRKTEQDRASDRKVNLNWYSTSRKALENSFNENAPLTLQITEGMFQKGENEILNKVEWKEGAQTLEQDGRVYFIVINKTEDPRLKTFEESRGLAISDYQSYLEEEWLKELRRKYPVEINDEEVRKLVR